MKEQADFENDAIPNPWSLPLETLDVSKAEIFQNNLHGEYFRRLRQESPVHFCPESQFGPFWSITKFNDIVAIDSDHKRFSSDTNIVIGDAPAELVTPMFIAMDEPKHGVQRKAVQSAVAPQQLSELEVLIRQRVGNILDSLPLNDLFIVFSLLLLLFYLVYPLVTPFYPVSLCLQPCLQLQMPSLHC